MDEATTHRRAPTKVKLVGGTTRECSSRNVEFHCRRCGIHHLVVVALRLLEFFDLGEMHLHEVALLDGRIAGDSGCEQAVSNRYVICGDRELLWLAVCPTKHFGESRRLAHGSSHAVSHCLG